MAVEESVDERWCSVAEAAGRLGLPERAIYRQIATQALQARRDQHGSLLVCLDGAAAAAPAEPYPSLARPTVSEPALTPDRARALTEFANGLVHPLVSRLAEQEAIIREQAEELGRLRTRTQQAGQLEQQITPAFERQLAELAAIREEIARLANRRRWWPFG